MTNYSIRETAISYPTNLKQAIRKKCHMKTGLVPPEPVGMACKPRGMLTGG